MRVTEGEVIKGVREVIKGVGEVRGAVGGPKIGADCLWGWLGGEELVKGSGKPKWG